MNIIDLFVIGLIVFFSVIGFIRGMIQQLFALCGLVAGHLVGIRYYAVVSSVLKLQFKYAELVGYLIILLAIFIVAAIIGHFIGDKVRDTKLSLIDRVFGLFAGFLKGGLLAVLLVFVLVIMLPKDAQVLHKSMMVPQAIAVGKWMTKGFPPQFSDSFQKKIRAAEKQPPGSFLFNR